MISVYFTDVSCFYYVVHEIPRLSEQYVAITPLTTCSQFGQCSTSYVSSAISTSITPSFIYSYQCGSQILINYVPTILAKYTISGILLPILKVIVLMLSPTSWIRNTWVVQKFLLPYTSSSMHKDKLLDDLMAREFRTYRLLGTTVIDVLMLLTYGILAPFTTFIIVTSIVVNEVINNLQLGSMLNDDDLRATMLSSVYLSNAYYLFISLWKGMLITVLLFMTLFIFDMIADVYTNIPGTLGVLGFWVVMCICFYSRARFNRLISCVSHAAQRVFRAACNRQQDEHIKSNYNMNSNNGSLYQL